MSQKIGEKKEHFSIRKLTVGAASVLIGTSLYLGGQKPATVHADPDDGSAKVTQVKTDQTEPETSLGVKKDSETSDADVNKKGTTSAGKEETHYGVNESKKNAASEETKGVQDSERKEPAKVETGDKTQKETLDIPKDKTDANGSSKEKNQANPNKDESTVDALNEKLNDILKPYNKIKKITRTITFYYPDGTIKVIKQVGSFRMLTAYLTIEKENAQIKYRYQIYYVGQIDPKDGQGSSITKEFSDTNPDRIIKEVSSFKNDLGNIQIIFNGSDIKYFDGYKSRVETVTHFIDSSTTSSIDAENVPEQPVTHQFEEQIIDVRYVPEPPVNPTPGTNPAPTEPTQPTPQTKPQPTVAPVHPEKPNKPGNNVKPKPEKPATPNHHTNQHNNNSGSIKPKAQKMSNKASVTKTVNRANPKVVKVAQTVAPKAQTPAVKKAAKASLPQTGENKSISTAAILIGGAAAVIGLIGLAATRKHIF